MSAQFIQYISTALTGCFLLLLRHQQSTSLSIPHSHTFAEWSQFRIVLFVLPDVQEWLAVGEFEVIVLGQTDWLAVICKMGKRGLTLEKLPRARRIPEFPPQLLP